MTILVAVLASIAAVIIIAVASFLGFIGWGFRQHEKDIREGRVTGDY